MNTHTHTHKHTYGWTLMHTHIHSHKSYNLSLSNSQGCVLTLSLSLFLSHYLIPSKSLKISLYVFSSLSISLNLKRTWTNIPEKQNLGKYKIDRVDSDSIFVCLLTFGRMLQKLCKSQIDVDVEALNCLSKSTLTHFCKKNSSVVSCPPTYFHIRTHRWRG